ncbi:MAG: hypothetical protein HFI39_05955, partial [Lachnospiraceae bacterium]|nr:hypothetical protein [Lachnospiraceae bacterium]
MKRSGKRLIALLAAVSILMTSFWSSGLVSAAEEETEPTVTLAESGAPAGMTAANGEPQESGETQEATTAGLDESGETEEAMTAEATTAEPDEGSETQEATTGESEEDNETVENETEADVLTREPQSPETSGASQETTAAETTIREAPVKARATDTEAGEPEAQAAEDTFTASYIDSTGTAADLSADLEANFKAYKTNNKAVDGSLTTVDGVWSR